MATPTSLSAPVMLRRCLARMRRNPLDYRVRVEAAVLMVTLDERSRAQRILRSCADYYTLAGFPLRALWAIKLLERHGGSDEIVGRSLSLLEKHYARREHADWGDPIFEASLRDDGALSLDELPDALEQVISEVERRATDIIRGASFPEKLPRCPLLSELNPGAFLTAVRHLHLRQFFTGERIVEQGQPGTAVQILVNGVAEVLKQRENGADVPLARLTEGEVFGEMALITESPRVASVVALERVDVLELPQYALGQLGSESAQLQDALARQVCDRMLKNLMRLSPVFRGVPDDRRGELIRRFTSRLVEADEDVIVEGQVGRGLFIVLDGLVQVTLRKSGRRHVLNWLREGDLFGEISLLKNTPATATCTAARRTMLMFLGRDDFECITKDFPEIISRMNELGDYRLLDNIYSLA